MNTKINKFFNNIQYNFKDITELRPENKDFSLNITNFIKDSYAHDFNPRRYNFYIQFMEALNNPDVLKNVLYANTVIKSKKEVENESIRKIVNGLQRLYMTPTHTKDVDQNKYNEQKKLKKIKINKNITARINNLVNSNDNDNMIVNSSKKTIVKNIIDSTFEDNTKPDGISRGGVGNQNTRRPFTTYPQTRNVSFNDENTNKPEILRINTAEYPPEPRHDKVYDSDQQIISSSEKKVVVDENDAKNNSIISLYYQKIIADITQITNNLNKISKKYKSIDKYITGRKDTSDKKIFNESAKLIDDPMNGLNDIAPFINGNNQTISISHDYPLKSFLDSTQSVFKQENKELLNIDIIDQSSSEAKPLSLKRGGDYILEDSEYQKLNDLVYDIENDTMRPINKLDISNEDRIVFIGVTFIIRFIALSLIEWSMNTNFISSFKQAFMFYCIIYISIFCFITILVNIIYNYPLQQLYTDKSLVDIQSMLYYFYIYTNGPMRLVIHLIFILILMLIPFIINMGNNMPDKANFNYETKKYTRNTLSRFTLVIWIITSLIAVRY
jgi:hypothetical protein